MPNKMERWYFKLIKQYKPMMQLPKDEHLWLTVVLIDNRENKALYLTVKRNAVTLLFP